MDQSSGVSPKVLYIGGTGRSGSTLLAKLLGTFGGYAPVGELRYVWERGFVANHLCECGLPFRECDFWQKVAAEAFGGFGGVDVAALQEDMRAIDRIRYVPELLSDRVRTQAFRRHLHDCAGVLTRLYSSIAAVSGRPVVVDSSKDASYAFVLHAIDRVDLAVVHLVRDSRAVAHSWTRAKPRPEIHWQSETMMLRTPVSSALLWDAHNVLFEMFERTDRPFVRVRYEDLVDRGEETLATIAALYAPSTGSAQTRTPELGHSISGNPMRFTRGPLRVQVDNEWIDAMTDRDRRLVTVATAPFLARYGYRIASTMK